MNIAFAFSQNYQDEQEQKCKNINADSMGQDSKQQETLHPYITLTVNCAPKANTTEL